MRIVLHRYVRMPEAEGSAQESPHQRRYAGVAPDVGGRQVRRFGIPFSDTRAVLSDSSRVLGYSASEVKRVPTRSATIMMPAPPKRRTSCTSMCGALCRMRFHSEVLNM